MKKKTIEAAIKGKFNTWIKSIDDKDLVYLLKRDSIITGGCTVSFLLGEPVNDYDVYFATEETTLAVANYYAKQFAKKPPYNTIDVLRDGLTEDRLLEERVEVSDTRISIRIKSSGIQENKSNDKDDDKFSPIFMSSNAITLSGKIQCIVRFYGEPDEIHKNYDFVHCTPYWLASTGKITWSKEALEAIITKELIYQGSKYPIASIVRTRKFIQRGWSIKAGAYLQMIFQTQDLDLTDLSVLEDQLTGVDTSYFESLVSALRSDLDNNKDLKLDNMYIMKVIEKVL